MIDPSIFKDSVAETTSWSPVKKGGANFCTHKLVEISPNRIEFRTTFFTKIFFMIFFVAGIGAICFGYYEAVINGKALFGDKIIVLFLTGFVSAVVGGCMFYFSAGPIVFDKYSQYFWKGKKDPNLVFDKKAIKVYASLAQIHALQLISEYCVSSGKHKYFFYSYELNIVLKDGERINVIDHGKLKKIKEDANVVSNFLGKPLWDAT